MSRNDGVEDEATSSDGGSFHEELRSLLAPYALDALDEDETQLLRAHLKVCSQCSREVEEYLEIAAKLASSPVPAPLELWEKIAAQIDGPALPAAAPHLIPISRPSRMPRWRSSSRQLVTVFASAAASVIIVLGILVAHLSGQVSSLRSVGTSSATLSAVASSVLTNPSTVIYHLASKNGTLLADVAVDAHHSAYVIPRHLRSLPSSETYQLWAVSHGSVISLGVLGDHPKLFWCNIVPQMTSILVNIEPAGGTQVPTKSVLGSVVIA
jgi:hypothetical protein